MLGLLVVAGVYRLEIANASELAPAASPGALMRAVFAAWTPSNSGPFAVRWTTLEGGRGSGSYHLQPHSVVRLSEAAAVLVVTGTGNGSHSGTGIVGAYWFTRERGGWRKTHAHPGFMHPGTFGEPGDVQVHAFGAGSYLVSAEYTGCWQGDCFTFLQLRRIDATGVRSVLPENDFVLLGRDNMGAGRFNLTCASVFAAIAADQWPGRLAEERPRKRCYDVIGRWRLDASARIPRLEIRFTGRSVDLRSNRPSIVSVRETLVYAQHADRLVVARGRNPLPRFESPP